MCLKKGSRDLLGRFFVGHNTRVCFARDEMVLTSDRPVSVLLDRPLALLIPVSLSVVAQDRWVVLSPVLMSSAKAICNRILTVPYE